MLTLMLTLAAAATPVVAEPPLRPGIGATDRRLAIDSADWPWQAIGRLNRAGGGFCTATLIAPAAVLTAAHCLWDARREGPVNAHELHFLAGYRRGDYLAHGIGARIETPADQPPPASPFGIAELPAMGRDWAIVHLQAPLAVRPIPVGHLEMGVGIDISRAGYSQDRPHLLAIRWHCHVLDHLADAPLLLTDCDATRGDSGSPLLQGDGDRLQLVGMTVAVADNGRSAATIAIDAAALPAAVGR